MTDYVSKEVCDLHQQVTQTMIDALKEKDNTLECRMEGIESGIAEVRDLQKQLLYCIIFVAVGVSLTLFGVVLGRGIDFGWLMP
jgi:hypothetical protein